MGKELNPIKLNRPMGKDAGLMTLDELKKIFEVDSIQGDEHDLKTLLRWSEELAQERGVEYLRQNKGLLLDQWEHILNDLM
jgi:hypothetical protein